MSTLEVTAALAVVQRRNEAAARLLGATEAWHTRSFYIRLPGERQEREACITALSLAMDE